MVLNEIWVAIFPPSSFPPFFAVPLAISLLTLRKDNTISPLACLCERKKRRKRAKSKNPFDNVKHEKQKNQEKRRVGGVRMLRLMKWDWKVVAKVVFMIKQSQFLLVLTFVLLKKLLKKFNLSKALFFFLHFSNEVLKSCEKCFSRAWKKLEKLQKIEKTEGNK